MEAPPVKKILRAAVTGVVVVTVVGCGGGSATPTPTPGVRPNASEMFDKKEMPRGTKPGGKADPG
jgi:hypothetical protein